MTPGRRKRLTCWIAALTLVLACSSCKFLQDEFTFLDRAAPAAPPAEAGTDAAR